MGTPKTLAEAIENGLAHPGEIEEHILDFLRQRFSAAYLEASGDPSALALLEWLAKEIGVVK